MRVISVVFIDAVARTAFMSPCMDADDSPSFELHQRLKEKPLVCVDIGGNRDLHPVMEILSRISFV